MEEQGSEKPATAVKKDRSPSFPFITLTKAVGRARELFEAARQHEMRLADAAAAMKYAPKSSGAIQTLAALIAYGLVEDSGSGADRKFRVSDLGFKILEDARPGAKKKALAEAAMAPKAIASYASEWGKDRPADAICLSTLRIDGGFTDDGAKVFLRVFDDAMSFAKVGNSDKGSDTDGSKADEEEATKPEISVGDWVCVESNGQIVFEKTRVRAINEPWVFVEASETGANMIDVTLVEKGAGEAPPVLPIANKLDDPVTLGEEMDRFTVDEGVVKVIFPLGMTSDSVEELEEFFELFIKKAKRKAQKPS